MPNSPIVHRLNTGQALRVEEANLSMKLRLGASEEDVLMMQSNLASTYDALGRLEEAARMS